MLLKDKSCCLKCRYGYFPDGAQRFLGEPMCLYFHDTGLHRVNDENHCESFSYITEEERKLRAKQNTRRYADDFTLDYLW